MRNMLNAAFRYLSSKKWNKKLVKKFHKFLMEKALNINDFSVPDGKENSYKIQSIASY